MGVCVAGVEYGNLHYVKNAIKMRVVENARNFNL